jgi:hypothetical protein
LSAYPPDLQAEATKLVLEQAEALAEAERLEALGAEFAYLFGHEPTGADCDAWAKQATRLQTRDP